MDKRPNSNVQNIKFDINKQANTQRRTRGDEKTSQSKGIQYHECEGSTEVCKALERQKKLNGQLQAEASDHIKRFDEINKEVEEQKKLNAQLQAERSDHLGRIYELNEEVIKLNTDLEHIRKHVKMMSKGTEAFEEMIQKQSFGKPKPIGFEYERLNKHMNCNSDTMYTPLRKMFVASSGLLPPHPSTYPETEPKTKSNTRPRG
ncbi:hypothetical protein A2U01_0022405, partial [Trifolium medium]|nr:hypothetical protein [Trifolium medium]